MYFMSGLHCWQLAGKNNVCMEQRLWQPYIQAYMLLLLSQEHLRPPAEAGTTFIDLVWPVVIVSITGNACYSLFVYKKSEQLDDNLFLGFDEIV
jgi:hypothetical protein